MDLVLHVSRSHGSWQSQWSPRSLLARNASTSFRTILRRSNSHSPKTNLGSWMRSALFPLSIQGGCCRSKEPTVWSPLIAGSVYARRKSRIDQVCYRLESLLLHREGLAPSTPSNSKKQTSAVKSSPCRRSQAGCRI